MICYKKQKKLHRLVPDFSYDNGSAETLAWIIRTITGKSLAENVSERIWSQIGMEENAYYVTDETKLNKQALV